MGGGGGGVVGGRGREKVEGGQRGGRDRGHVEGGNEGGGTGGRLRGGATRGEGQRAEASRNFFLSHTHPLPSSLSNVIVFLHHFT